MTSHKINSAIHVCALIPGQPYVAFFYSYNVLPLPFKDFFTKEEFRIFKFIGHHCSTCLQIKPLWDKVSGYEHWILYCHCENPRSLQCLAAAIWVTSKIVKFMESFTWAPSLYTYNLLSNAESSRMCHVICSSYYANCHLVFLNMVSTCKINLEGLSVRVFRFCKEDDIIIALFKCKRCINKSESALYSCAQRIAAVINLAHVGVRSNAYSKRLFHKKYKARLDVIMSMVFEHRYAYAAVFQ